LDVGTDCQLLDELNASVLARNVWDQNNVGTINPFEQIGHQNKVWCVKRANTDWNWTSNGSPSSELVAKCRKRYNISINDHTSLKPIMNTFLSLPLRFQVLLANAIVSTVGSALERAETGTNR
jgi:hypothetical protein